MTVKELIEEGFKLELVDGAPNYELDFEVKMRNLETSQLYRIIRVKYVPETKSYYIEVGV